MALEPKHVDLNIYEISKSILFYFYKRKIIFLVPLKLMQGYNFNQALSLLSITIYKSFELDLCRLKYGLLWMLINMFFLAQISPIWVRSFVRCYLSSCEILMSMRQKLRKMIFFIFIFQMEGQVLIFFSSQIRYGVFNVCNLKRKS